MMIPNKRGWLLILAAAMLAPSAAHAHAHLLRSEPASDARLGIAPQVLRLFFSERPELAMSLAALKDSNGATWSLGPVSRTASDKLGIEFPVKDSLPPGHYTLSWRTAAADGHPSRGQIAFDVLPGSESSITPPVKAGAGSSAVATQPEHGDVVSHVSEEDHSASVPNSLARALLFTGLIVLIGVVTFALVVLPNSADVNAASRAAMLSRASFAGFAAAILIIAAAVLRLYLESKMMSAMPDMPGMAGMTTEAMLTNTAWGSAFILQVTAAGVALIAFALTARRIVWAWYLAAACALVLGITPALSGHAAASPNFTTLVIVSDWLHVASGGAWVGTLLCVMTIGVPIACTCEGDERWTCVSSLVHTFSRIAMFSVAMLLISGSFASWVHLSAPSDLWTSSYGKLLSAKVALAAVALGGGAYNLKRVQPTLSEERGTQALRKSATLELVAGLLILIVTGFLTGLSP